ncbi:MAG: DUF4391 domain-containing protein [Oscillospiraceae bacterium]|nr:DUF4391 domain-containing protein [Oscillospiraceae bacterium]
MLDLPASTVFNKRIPKQKFYDNLTVTAQMKRIFVEQISLITWQNKIAPATINIAEGESVKEIEVIVIRLNQRELDKRVLPLIDKEIPYHILFILEYSGEVQAWVGYKEQAKNTPFKPGTYYHSDWLPPEALNLRIDGLDLDKVYENFIRQVAGERLNATAGDIKEAVELDERRKKLAKEIASLEKKIQREKQFSKQVEFNTELKRLKMELHGVSHRGTENTEEYDD